jgi:hypothetical protein
MTLERVGTPKKVFSQTKPAYEENLVWIETDGSGNIVAQYVGKFDEFIEVENAAGYPIHFDHIGDTEPETRGGDAWLEPTAFSTVTVDTPTTGDNTYEFDIASLEDVFNVTAVTIIGEQSTAAGGPVTISGSGTGVVDPAGTSTTDGQVVFTGVETTTSDSASLGTLSDGGTGSVSVGGNIAPTNEEITFTGRSSSISKSINTQSAGAYTRSIDVAGNLPPSGPASGSPEISVTGQPQSEADTSTEWSTIGDEETLFGTEGGTGLQHIENAPGYIDRVEVPVQQEDTAESTVDFYIIGGATTASDTVSNGVFIGTLIADTFGQHQYRANFDGVGFEPGNSTVTLVAKVTNWNPDSRSDLPLSEQVPRLDPDAADPNIRLSSDPQTFEVSTDTGESLTITGGSGSSAIDLSGASSVTIDAPGVYDLSLNWQNRYETEDPSATVNGQTVSYNGRLSSGESVTRSVDLSTGSDTIDVSTGHEVDVDASWTQVDATENPSVSLSGSTASFSGILRSGQTATRSIDFGADSYTADVSVTNDCETEITWTDVFETVDPSISLNGTTSQFTGLVPQGDSVTVDVSKSSLTTGTNTLELVSGGPAGLLFSYDEVDTSSSNLTVRLYYSDGAVWKEVP